MAGYFKIINRNSLLLQARTKTRKVGGLLKIITWGRKPLKWKLNFLINDFLTVNQKWGRWISNGSVINRSIPHSQALKEICLNHFLLADCGTCLNFQRLLQKAHITFYNTIGLCEYRDMFWSGVLNAERQAVCFAWITWPQSSTQSSLLVCGSLIHRFKNTGLKIFGKKFQKIQRAKLEFSVQKAKFV